MIVHDVAGREYDIRPHNSNHVYVTLVHDEGFLASGLYARRDDQVPDTRAIIEELPTDLSKIEQYEPTGLSRGEEVVFLRYAEREGFVMFDYYQETVNVLDEEKTFATGEPVYFTHQVLSRRGIYAMSIRDIVAVFREPAAA